MPRKLKLTFQKGTALRAGRWRKIYRGKTYYLGVAGSKTDVDGYKAALEEWKSLKLKIDAATIALPEPLTQDYHDVIREWELVLSWAVQNGDDEEAVTAREKLADLRERLQSNDPSPVSHDDRLWSRFRPSQETMQSIADMAIASSAIEAVTDDSDLEEVYNTERHLLYVACTRARDRLMISGVKPASEFLEDLTLNSAN